MPLALRAQSFDDLVLERFHLEAPQPDLDGVDARSPTASTALTGEVRIALVGKYVQLHDAYLSVVEALRHAAIHHGAELKLTFVDAESVSRQEAIGSLADVDGVLIPGGFGGRGIEGKIAAVRFARERGVPFLGICLGMQVATVEFARNVVGLEGANSTEFDRETPYPVVDLLPEQKDVQDKGGTMRLGAEPVVVRPGTRAHAAYESDLVYERHRHRWEVSNALRPQLEEHGLVIGGVFASKDLVEMIELPNHPFFVASQFHPEFKSRPTRPAPLFRDFVGAAVERRAGTGRGVGAGASASAGA